jgi:hypothetical protein
LLLEAEELAPVCAENLVRLDLMTESHNVGRDGRIPPVPAELAWLAVQVKESACGSKSLSISYWLQ